MVLKFSYYFVLRVVVIDSQEASDTATALPVVSQLSSVVRREADNQGRASWSATDREYPHAAS